jgi:hypothetical protein
MAIDIGKCFFVKDLVIIVIVDDACHHTLPFLETASKMSKA